MLLASQVKQSLKGFSLTRRLIGWYRSRLVDRQTVLWREILREDGDLWTRSKKGCGTGKRIMLATSLGAYQPAVAMDSLLAVALALRGADVHVLLCDAALPACQLCDTNWYPRQETFVRVGPQNDLCKRCFGPTERLFKSLRMPVHRISEYYTKEESVWADDLARVTPIEAIPTYKLDAAAVGEHANAGALRFYASGTLYDEPAGESVLRRYFKASLLSYMAVKRLLHHHRFDVAVLHHGIYVPQGPVREACRQKGVHVVTWHIGYRQKSFIFSHDETYHHSLMTEPVDKWDRLELTPEMEKQITEYLQSRFQGTKDWIHFNRDPIEDIAEIQKELGIDFSKPSIGMLTNVVWDAQLHYPKNIFSNMLDWVFQSIEYFKGRPDLQLIVRVHPAEVTGQLPSRQKVAEEIRREFPKLPDNVFVIPPESKVSTYQVMMHCDSVIIYGTKTGVELTTIGIPVIVAGEAWIRGKGVTQDANSKDEYFEILDALPCGKRMDTEQMRRARKYAYHFFFRRMIPIRFISQRSPGVQHYQVMLEELKELMPGRDLGLDVICAGILYKREFIYPAGQFPPMWNLV